MDEIIPGKRIGKYSLGMSFEELKNTLSSENINHETERISLGQKVLTDNIEFWIEGDIVTQITVQNEFRGKLLGCIGIGSSLKDLKNQIGSYKQSDLEIVPTYEIEKLPGICFEIDDFNENNEEASTIKYISIF